MKGSKDKVLNINEIKEKWKSKQKSQKTNQSKEMEERKYIKTINKKGTWHPLSSD